MLYFNQGVLEKKSTIPIELVYLECVTLGLDDGKSNSCTVPRPTLTLLGLLGTIFFPKTSKAHKKICKKPEAKQASQRS